jgi:hypothetical protein
MPDRVTSTPLRASNTLYLGWRGRASTLRGSGERRGVDVKVRPVGRAAAVPAADDALDGYPEDGVVGVCRVAADAYGVTFFKSDRQAR